MPKAQRWTPRPAWALARTTCSNGCALKAPARPAPQNEPRNTGSPILGAITTSATRGGYIPVGAQPGGGESGPRRRAGFEGGVAFANAGLIDGQHGAAVAAGHRLDMHCTSGLATVTPAWP